MSCGDGQAGGKNLACMGSSVPSPCCCIPLSVRVCHSVPWPPVPTLQPPPQALPRTIPPLDLDGPVPGCREEAGSKFGSQPSLPLLFIPSVQEGWIRFSLYSLQRRKRGWRERWKGKGYTKAERQQGGEAEPRGQGG